MGFYYLNLFSLLFLAMIYAVAIFLLWLVWTKALARSFTGPIVCAVIVAIVIAPWVEEFWIAYHFGQACKGAGTFIYKKVEVDGYYDGTGGGTMTRLVGRPPYKFIESIESEGTFRRVERASTEEKASALARYAENNSGNLPGAKEWITYLAGDRLQVTVEMDTGYAWRITTLDQPTARYHYKWPDRHASIGHKVVKHEALVVDSIDLNANPLARYTRFSRDAPWFFVGLDRPDFSCDAPDVWPLTNGTFAIDYLVLIPAAAKEYP